MSKPKPAPRKKKVSKGVKEDSTSVHLDEPVPDIGRYDSSSYKSDTDVILVRPRQKQQIQLTTEDHRDHLGDDQRDTSGQAQETARDASDTTRDGVDVSSPDAENFTPTMNDSSQDGNDHDADDEDDVHGDDDDRDDSRGSTQEKSVATFQPDRQVPARRPSRQRQAPLGMRDGQFFL